MCRTKRHTALLQALIASEQRMIEAEHALVAAAKALAALRAVAELGPHATATLRLGGGT